MVMSESSAVFSSIVCQDSFYLQPVMLIKRQDIIMQDEGCMVGQFARVQVSKSKGVIDVYDRLHVDFSYILEFACIVVAAHLSKRKQTPRSL